MAVLPDRASRIPQASLPHGSGHAAHIRSIEAGWPDQYTKGSLDGNYRDYVRLKMFPTVETAWRKQSIKVHGSFPGFITYLCDRMAKELHKSVSLPAHHPIVYVLHVLA